MQQVDLFSNNPAPALNIPHKSPGANPVRRASTVGRGSRDTSRDALAEHKETGRLGKQQQVVFAVLTRSGQAFTRAELAANTGLPVSSICGRVKELLDLQVVVEDPRRPCSVTGKAAHPVRSA